MAALRIVPEASEVHIDARSSLHAIHGRATQIGGEVDVEVVDGRPGTSLRGRIEVPVAGLRSGNPLEDRELHRRVDARRFPTILGEVRSATSADGDGTFRVEGDITFHGVTQPATGEVRISVEGDRLVVEGEHVFDVRDFGITPPRILMLRVEPDVTVRIRLVVDLGGEPPTACPPGSAP
jgi:polyisoprenoid-binding protein YceI